MGHDVYQNAYAGLCPYYVDAASEYLAVRLSTAFQISHHMGSHCQTRADRTPSVNVR